MPATVNQEYFSQPMAIELEQRREEARLKHCIPYDCFHCILDAEDGMVYCRKKHQLNSLSLKGVLKGRSSPSCQLCPDYNTEEEKR